MSELVVSPTAEEQAQEDFAPLPECALCTLTGVTLTPWQRMTPLGPHRFMALFVVREKMHAPGAQVRYSAFIPGRTYVFDNVDLFNLLPGDEVTVTLTQHIPQGRGPVGLI